MKKIHIVDSVCGSKKTETMINFINSKPNNQKFLYITPFLSEIERIKDSCSGKNFKEPEIYGSKINGFKYLFNEGFNIVSTHALFRMFDKEILDLAKFHNYTLIMDEVADVVDVVGISSFDLDTLLEKYVEVDSNGMLKWIADDYEGAFEKYKRLCNLNSLAIYGERGKRNALIWLFPIDVFESFKEVYILTYMFSAQLQKYYYDFYGIKYDYKYIKDSFIVDEKTDYSSTYYKSLINICDSRALNRIGEDTFALSNSWYYRNKNNVLLTVLHNNCINYFKHISKTKSKDNMWTTFKEYQGKVKGKGYSKGFAPINIRATNDYIEKASVAYLTNRYLNPIIKRFFELHNIEVDEDLFALSELIQFVFRTRIRIGEPINLYIPSKRMRGLLENWMDGKYD